MITIREPHHMQETAIRLRIEGRRIGVVPTMGALHEGHCALIRRARECADIVVTTIFVNPTQFAAGEDLSRYPRPFEDDVRKAESSGADYVFAPSVETMYPSGFSTSVVVEGVTSVLEGAFRPTHFKGVTTVVAKLFQLTLPHVAVFGQKDGQQVAVIRKMIADLNIPVDLDIVPTIRESDGLALSSRNVYLSAEHRAEAPILYRAMVLASEMIGGGERSADVIRREVIRTITSGSSAVVDYVSVADAGTLVEASVIVPGQSLMLSLAARFGTTRLIDNILLQSS